MEECVRGMGVKRMRDCRIVRKENGRDKMENCIIGVTQ